MKKFIFTLIFILTVSIEGYSQTITLTPIGGVGVNSIPITLEHYITTTSGTTFVRVFRTHYGNGNTSQYAQYPMTRSEMDKLFNTSYAATNWWWQGNINATTSLNFTNYTTLTNAGASVPSNGDYYSTEVTFTFVAAETGTYSFRLTSDDGSDLTINGFSVIEYYGGKGIGSYKYGTYSMVQGSQYTVVARMQEYGGGDGLILQWKRPSAGNYYLLTSEVGVTSSSWVSQGTKSTNSNGQASWTNSSNWPYRVTINVNNEPNVMSDSEMNYLMYKKAGLSALTDWDFYTCDMDGTGGFDWDDIKYGYDLLNGGLYYKSYIFTQSQKTTIEANPTTNYYNTYPPTQSGTFTNQNQFYIMGTGKHNASPNSNIGKLQ
jgi:hypothetical protein